MTEWLAALAEADRAGEACVLVTVVRTAGSVPREAGAKMVVTRHDQADTIGGGALEHGCVAHARSLLGGGSPVTRDFPLGPALGQCCGGHVTVLFEPLAAPWRIALYGAGHVGRAVVRVLATLPCRVDWIDAREEQFPATLPANVHARAPADPVGSVADLPDATTMVVMTHDHALDFELVAAGLRRPHLGAVLLIGSDTKRARFARRLGKLADDARFVCPIGDPAIVGKLPAEIAVATAAELLRLRGSRRRETVSDRSLAEDVHGSCGAGCPGCGGGA